MNGSNNDNDDNSTNNNNNNNNSINNNHNKLLPHEVNQKNSKTKMNATMKTSIIDMERN